MFVKHKRTGNIYEVVSRGEMKHPDTGDWVPAVFYMPMNRQDGQASVYARMATDFDEKFEAVL